MPGEKYANVWNAKKLAAFVSESVCESDAVYIVRLVMLAPGEPVSLGAGAMGICPEVTAGGTLSLGGT